ncbi:UV radiation resistance-associated gene protein [Battus philenor]|uniref:UV radiation resistance-associated gene protein n=1 Tax=Battus philenor TaxID=42288 RepID=UPI0035D029E7
MMFGRPRCREWTPLATQQLRLRSLIQIVGYNIRPPEWCTHQCSYYLTLHHTTMSAPFYTSERICSIHPKWKEIDSEITQRMSSTNVVIRIWCHILTPSNSEEKNENSQDTIIQTWGVYFSGLRFIGANLALNFTSDCFKSNTLVFQMHGGYFCSYKSLKLDVIPPENEVEHGSLSSDSSGRTNPSKIVFESKVLQSHRLIKESRSISPSKYSKIPEIEYSKSHSPVDKAFKQNFPTLRTSASLNISVNHRDGDRSREDSCERKRNDPIQIYEHSPDNLNVGTGDVNCDNFKNASQEELCGSKIDLSETAESYDLRNESDGEPKYRYLALNFLKSEIRPSYNASKLQKLHLLQYSIKKLQESVQEIKEKIYKKSAVTEESWVQTYDDCDIRQRKSKSQRNLFSPDEKIFETEKSSSQSDLSSKNGRVKDEKPMSNGPRLTLKLNDLLSFKSKPSPFQRAEHVRLTKQLEILRFKRIILSDERDSKLANIRRLKEKHAKLFEENQDVGSELMQSYHTLSRRNELLKETKQSCGALRELAARTHANLANQRCELLTQLHQLFYIEQKDATTWRIIGVTLPICDDDNTRTTNAVSDSVAAGFVAQATTLAAAILNQPLRYKITLLGSASKILDVMPDWPDPNIPLFARGGDITMFRYAMFLLNKCIAQLLWGRGMSVVDMRPTLNNLQRLLITPSNPYDTSKLFGTYRWLSESHCPRTQSLRSLVASDRCKYRQFNRFKDCVDGQSPQSMINVRRHKHSRSVGSYHDDQELSTLNASTTSIMGSDSNIYNMKLNQTNSQSDENLLKPHNSDSEISKMGTEVRIVESNSESKVMFTLGDDTTLVDLETEKLVKISINNDDEWAKCVDENVKRICSEIENFCSSKTGSETGNRNVTSADEVNESINNLIDKRKAGVEIEDGVDVSCDTCENNIDGLCEMECANNVRDVIVIPSAEAILDTEDNVRETITNNAGEIQ